jgi:hypothetical protein
MMKMEEIIGGIKPVDQGWIQKAQERTAQLVMPTRVAESRKPLSPP